MADHAEISDKPLMDVAVDVLLFLELSDEHTVSNDAAVSMMEQIATTLRRLAPVKRARFVRYLAERAASASSEDQRSALKSMASDLGLLPD